MDERAKYEAFLVELDKGGGNKPAHVVARVKADYTAKLQTVVEQLKSNHDVLTQHAKALSEQLKKLEAEEKEILDEQAEAEIRKQVGELSDSDWLVASKKAEARIIKIKESQQVTSGDINRIRGILGASTPTSTPAQPDAAATAKSVTDELAFLKSVVGTTGPVPKPPVPAAPATPVARPSQMKERLIEPDPMDVEAAPAASDVKPIARPTPVAPSESLVEKPHADVKINAKADERPLAANVPDGDLQLKARGVPGAKKTLKCQECGALNNPSEWYCERCGAELTSNI